MAKQTGANASTIVTTKKVTSIGNSKRSMPKNKRKRKSWKRYRGQGRR